MSKGLECLELIKKDIDDGIEYKYIDVDFASELLRLLDIIEIALKDYEKLQEEYKDFESIHEEIARHYNVLYKERLVWLKEHRVLNIIKDKNVNISILKDTDSVEEYNQISLYATKYSNHYSFCKQLNQQEYDLLKEVML